MNKKELSLDEIFKNPEDIESISILKSTNAKDMKGCKIYETDEIKDVRSGLFFKVYWNDRYYGWSCISEDGSMEQPLCRLTKHCVKV